MLRIKVSKLKKSFQDRLILDIEDLEVFEGDKVGIVGLNGCGKTTLLNIIAGIEVLDEGNVFIDKSFSYITQFHEKTEITEGKISKELNTPKEYHEYLSGGEKVKVRVSKALNENVRVILADEPTSNLDQGSISHLEENLKKFRGTLLLISHDREFLDNVCNRIIEIENGLVREYSGNYSDYVRLRDERLKREKFEYDKYWNEKNRLEEAINLKSNLRDGVRTCPKRFGNSEARLAKMGGQKAKKSMDNAIKSLKSRIERLEVKQKPQENQDIKVDIFEGKEFFSNYPIEVKGVTIGFKDKILLDNICFKVKRNKKIALIGDNGCGKTSLIKEIIKGNSNIKIANRVNIGYFEQDLKILDEEKSILDNIKESSSFNETFIRIILARFLFRTDSVYKKVHVLSGGEKVKVALCKIILSNNNLLILDEPTNYLDIYSMEALEESLINTNKTMIIVSHDRRFVSKICNEILSMQDKGVVHYPYSFSEWIEKCNEIKVTKEEKEKIQRKMVLQNKIAEAISLLSIETNLEKKTLYENNYETLLKELNSLNM